MPSRILAGSPRARSDHEYGFFSDVKKDRSDNDRQGQGGSGERSFQEKRSNEPHRSTRHDYRLSLSAEPRQRDSSDRFGRYRLSERFVGYNKTWFGRQAI
jgi:hypothetical protein